jgi:hypothetical protein
MRTVRLLLVLACCFQTTGKTYGAEKPSLDPHLEPLRPLLEKTWSGKLEGGKPDKPMLDVMRWERALNGKAIRILHSINDGVYGGETILRWDEKKQTAVYHYFTTAGYMTVGKMTSKDGKISTHEVVEGGANGVTEVRATTELRPDGTVRVKAEYSKDGKWQPGHEATYRQDPTAKVIFK